MVNSEKPYQRKRSLAGDHQPAPLQSPSNDAAPGVAGSPTPLAPWVIRCV